MVSSQFHRLNLESTCLHCALSDYSATRCPEAALQDVNVHLAPSNFVDDRLHHRNFLRRLITILLQPTSGGFCRKHMESPLVASRRMACSPVPRCIRSHRLPVAPYRT